MADNDFVNIRLALPKPIKVEFEDRDPLFIDGRISMGDALEIRQLDQDMGAAEVAMYAALDAANLAATDSEVEMDELRRLGDEAKDAIRAFEGAVDELSTAILVQFQKRHPDLESLPLTSDNARLICAIIWRRAFGANDEELQAIADSNTGDEEGAERPPTKRAASTSRNGSSRSASGTAGSRKTGSTRR